MIPRAGAPAGARAGTLGQTLSQARRSEVTALGGGKGSGPVYGVENVFRYAIAGASPRIVYTTKWLYILQHRLAVEKWAGPLISLKELSRLLRKKNGCSRLKWKHMYQVPFFSMPFHEDIDPQMPEVLSTKHNQNSPPGKPSVP